MLQRIHDSARQWGLVVIALVAVGFIFVGVDSGFGTTQFAAKVNGEDIPLTEFDRALQARQNQYQQLYRSEIDEALRREMRRTTIEGLIRQEAMEQNVAEHGYRVSDERVAGAIRDFGAFQINGEFSMQVYESLLTAEGLTPAGFEALQRRTLAVVDHETGLLESTFITPAEFRRYVELFSQTRQVAYATFDVERFLDQVTIDDAAVEAHYAANSELYQSTETVDLEYVELSLADIADGIEVSEEDLRGYYEENRERFQTIEERFTRHILFEVENGDEQAAVAEAEAALERIEGGEDFAAVAGEVSDDVGTRTLGGELGWLGRGVLEGPFEDALFELEEGAVAGPIRTDFGYHLIKFEDLRESEVQSFDAVREQLLAEYQSLLAEERFFDIATALENTAFNAYDELGPVAEETGLPLETLTDFPRSGNTEVFANSAPIVQAAFSEEVLDSGRNSELIEIAEDHVVVLRVAEHHPPATQPLEVVREQIREELRYDRARELVDEAAGEFFAALTAGGEAAADPAALAEEYNATWQPASWVERTDPELPSEVLSSVFAAPKPGEGEVIRENVALVNGNHVVFVLDEVRPGDPSAFAPEARDQRRDQLAERIAFAELSAFASTIVENATVRIPEEILEPQF